MKKLFALILALLMLCSCSIFEELEKPAEPPKEQPSSSEPEEKEEQPSVKTYENIYEDFGATSIGQIQFLDENYAYLNLFHGYQGAEKGFEYSVCGIDLETGEAEFVFSGSDFINRSFSVSEVALSSPWIFTGSEVFSNGIGESDDMHEKFPEVTFGYDICFDTQTLYWSDGGKIIAKSIPAGETRTVYEYTEWENPRIITTKACPSGEYIAFVADSGPDLDSGTDMGTRYLMCIDFEGNLLYTSEFGKDFRYYSFEIRWINAEKFAVFTSEPENKTGARIYSLPEGTEEIITFNFAHSAIQNNFAKSYPYGMICEMSSDESFSHRLWRINFEEGTAEEIYTAPPEIYISGFDLSPNGKTIGWIESDLENDCLKIITEVLP
ncbi:MAG: hypothetical protein IKL57_06665 [Oscillospiraceae bacterium]|nr:hypothetical protein [Oscillospiraceae bacterium]